MKKFLFILISLQIFHLVSMDQKKTEIGLSDAHSGRQLQWAILEDKLWDVVRRIETYNVDINGEDALTDEVPILLAASFGRLSIVEYLISKNAKINKTDKSGMTALHYAAKSGYSKIAAALIKAHIELDKKDNDGKTALHNAVENGHLDIVHMLIQAGALIDVVDNKGITPLISACAHGHYDIVKFLIQSKANINHKAYLGGTPLIHATINQYYKIVAFLIYMKADINLSTNIGLTPLMYAAVTGNAKIATLLVQGGARLNALDSLGQTALIYACKYGKREIVELLKKAGAHIHTVDSNGMNALSHASMHNYTDIMDLLLQAGADATVIDCCKNSALVWACRHENFRHAQLFIEAGADFNLIDEYKLTPFMYAAFAGRDDIIQLMLAHQNKRDLKHELVASAPLFAYLAEIKKSKDRKVLFKTLITSRFKDKLSHYNINAKDNFKHDALEYMVALPDMQCFRYLLAEPTLQIQPTFVAEKNCNVQVPDWFFGFKTLKTLRRQLLLNAQFGLGCYSKHADKINNLLLHTKQGTINALFQAIKQSDVEKFKKLVRQVKDLHVYDENWNNPLHIAFQTYTQISKDAVLKLHKSKQIIGLIITYNADLLVLENKDGHSPIALAILHSSLRDILKDLTRYQILLNGQSNNLLSARITDPKAQIVSLHKRFSILNKTGNPVIITICSQQSERKLILESDNNIFVPCDSMYVSIRDQFNSTLLFHRKTEAGSSYILNYEHQIKVTGNFRSIATGKPKLIIQKENPHKLLPLTVAISAGGKYMAAQK